MAGKAHLPVLWRTCLGPTLQAPAPGLCSAHVANAVMEMAVSAGPTFSLVIFMFFPEVLLFLVGCIRCGVLIYLDALRTGCFNPQAYCW